MPGQDSKLITRSGSFCKGVNFLQCSPTMEEVLVRQQNNESNSGHSGSETGDTDNTCASNTETGPSSLHASLDSQSERARYDNSPGCHFSPDYPRKAQYPAIQSELANITAAYPKLRPTGCSETFCQSGRMVKTNEHRVGRDRSVQDLRREAEDFLRQLRAENVIESDEDFLERLEIVLPEIARSSLTIDDHFSHERDLRGSLATSKVGGVWLQSFEELKHGLRLAWKHSSKCIMRSEYQTLEVCDFRHVKTSQEMGFTLIASLRQAFNCGNITPTVFVFPPRQPGERGPMIWNQQLLSFAAYEQEDNSILGDPANLQLTKDIIKLGWTPPSLRTRWDLLPIVAIAEGDEPFITELSEDDFPLVRISHPQYELQFEKLGLRWVPAPALSRLGFDIGGVQYTAAPFIGWFMDAEIGVRDLADSFRYDALPQVATALGWIESEHELDRSPEYERLAILSRAQTELNFAVFHSFRSAGVAMSDTLSASSMYCNYDDEHFRNKGYRLPSNPYWLAPPQGSIVPIWHRGGAPNYQPCPMICRHAQDPVKAWRRKRRKSITRESGQNKDDPLCSYPPSTSPHTRSVDQSWVLTEYEHKPNIHICFCSAASTARKLANELHKRLRDSIKSRFTLLPVTSLNNLNPRQVKSSDTLLVVASTAGHGEMPLNGQRFLKAFFIGETDTSIRFSLFGNGSSQYGDRHNAAAKAIHKHLVDQKTTPLGAGLYAGDTAKEDSPWTQFDEWYHSVMHALHIEPQSGQNNVHRRVSTTIEGRADAYLSYSNAKLLACTRTQPKGVQHVVLDIGEQHYEPLSHISLVVPNEPSVVRYALQIIGVTGDELVKAITSHDVTTKDFLTAFVDFDKPFSNIDWGAKLELLSHTKATP